MIVQSCIFCRCLVKQFARRFWLCHMNRPGHSCLARRPRGYLAATIADDQPPAVATVDAHQDADALPAVHSDEISGLGVGQVVRDQMSDYGTAGGQSSAHIGGASAHSERPPAAYRSAYGNCKRAPLTSNLTISHAAATEVPRISR